MNTPTKLLRPGESSEGRRGRILDGASVSMAIASLLMAAYRYQLAGWGTTVAVLAGAGLAVGAVPALGARLPLRSRLDVLMVVGLTALFATAYVDHGLEAPALPWLVLVAPMSIFVGGVRRGAIYGAVAGVGYGIVYLLHQRGIAFTGDTEMKVGADIRAIAFVSLLLCSWIVAALMERERARAAHAMAKSQADLERVLETTPDAVVVLVEGVVQYANAAFSPFADVDDPVGCRLRDFFDPRSPDGARSLRDERFVAEAGAGSLREIHFRGRDGRTIVAEVRHGGSIFFGGEAAQLILARDVTQQRALESQLRLADRLASVGVLAAGVAHEINNPLTYVLTNLTFVEGELDPNDEALEEAREAIDECLDGVRRVREIVADLKTFSRDAPRAIDSVDVRAVLDRVLHLARHDIARRARIIRDYTDVPRVFADEARLSQAFLNVVVNAVQAMEGKDNVLFASCRVDDEGRVVVEVRDTGQGLEPGTEAQLFDPFFTTKPVGEGTGLGLAITHQLVRSLGGAIRLENHPDGGAVATIQLPTESERPDCNPPLRAKPVPLHRENVLHFPS